jgi:hypothetical protein
VPSIQSPPTRQRAQRPVDLFIPEEINRRELIVQFLSDKQSAKSQARFKVKLAPFRWIIENLNTPRVPAFLLSVNAELPTKRFFVEAMHSRSAGNLFGLRETEIDRLIQGTRDSRLSDVTLSNLYRDFNSRLRKLCIAAPLMQVKHGAWFRSCAKGVQPSPVSEGYFLIRSVVNSCAH